MAIEIPPGFGRDLKRDRQPEVGFWIDGAVPFRGDTIRGYVEGIHRRYLEELAPRSLQESYDNSGLQVGAPGMELSGILVALDVSDPAAVVQQSNLRSNMRRVMMSGDLAFVVSWWWKTW